ncbi:LOW QUALITY PROTEIN: hypothetical protein KUTeg_018310 [Tegillarca granosa]|uniref:Uncharacterized protein n=1 Tax=Tegillarca granosa TaxID=220873 RepID=A0ABQ9ELD7_TEGGR|nr:LOW QUALITY PROTEIN: hypothetical protein KUTeg_018310 [Tegillarca granosa]
MSGEDNNNMFPLQLYLIDTLLEAMAERINVMFIPEPWSPAASSATNPGEPRKYCTSSEAIALYWYL